MRWDELFGHVVDHQPADARAVADGTRSHGDGGHGGAPGGQDSVAQPGSPLTLPAGGGVYLLTDEQDRLIQLASAADLKRAILNRLSPPGATGSAAGDPEVAVDAADGSGPGLLPASEVPETDRATPQDGVAADVDAGEPQARPGKEPRRSGGTGLGGAGLRRRADLSQIVRRIRYQPAHSAFETTFEYLRIAREVLPDTYLKNVAFGPAWFVHVDPAADIPRFAVSKLVQPAPGVTLGPFAAQSDAGRFVQILEDAFDLCRYLHILEQAPHGQPCAYHEMGRCPAPCGGLIPMSQYRETMAAALRFAAGCRREVLDAWAAQMRDAASELAFERAAALKQRIERAKGLDHAAYRWVRPVEAFSWLIVQRGGGRTRVKPFFVRGGRLHAGEPVPIKQLEAVVPGWLERLRQPGESDADAGDTLQRISESIWLVSHFLFRRERTGLFLEAGALPEPAVLAETIRSHFAAPPAASPTTSSDQADASPAGGPGEDA